MSLLPNVVRDASELVRRLRARYPEPEHAFFTEVSDKAGFSRSRSADAIAMNTWPSRGLTIHGFEVKVDRRDWVRELKDPAKAEAFFKRTHCWWLVVGDAGIVHPGELPPGWGLLVPHGKGLKVAVEAERREPELSLGFVAALLKRAVELRNTPPEEQAKALAEAREAGRRSAEEQAKRERQRFVEDFESLKQSVREFEAASGVRINRWDGREIGEAVRAVMEARTPYLAGRVGSAASTLKRVLEDLGALVPRLERAREQLAQAAKGDAPREGESS